MTRKQLQEQIILKIEQSGMFKSVIKNIAPPAQNIVNTPSIAVTYNNTTIVDGSPRYCQVPQGTIQVPKVMDVFYNVVIYNKQNTNNYEDITSDLLDEVISLLYTLSKEIDVYDFSPIKIKDDEGLIHPHQVTILVAKFRI